MLISVTSIIIEKDFGTIFAGKITDPRHAQHGVPIRVNVRSDAMLGRPAKGEVWDVEGQLQDTPAWGWQIKATKAFRPEPIYLDNELRDHNLFQAICRTNRLDGDDKDYGHIVDYKELFSNVQNAIAVYTSDELETESCGDDANVIVKDWLQEGKARLDAAREALIYLCAPVKQPQAIEQHIHYFCGDAANPAALSDTEPLRIAFYKAVAAYVRAYSDVATNLQEAGYTATQITAFEKETEFYAEVRAAIKNHSGEELDVKPFEADMRHLINTYIQADPANLLGDPAREAQVLNAIYPIMKKDKAATLAIFEIIKNQPGY